MDTQHVHPLRELGTFSIVMPAVWVVGAAAGFVLLANWPELFAAPVNAPVAAPAGAVPGAVAPATVPPTNDSSLLLSPAAFSPVPAK
jgi:hypothetical protein